MRIATKIRIALRHLCARPFQTFSVVSIVAFSVGLAVALFVLAEGLQLGLIRAVEPFDLIVGAKGSPYQLVLNTVFLQDAPVGNIPWEDYEMLSGDERVGFAVPVAFGDNYRGYPVIGTTKDILKIRVRPSDPLWMRLNEGRWFTNDGFEAVLGSRAASESGLRVGDTFRTSHGIVAGDEHERGFRVVGITDTARGPYDRAVFVPIETIWSEHEHHRDGGNKENEDEHEEPGEVTAVLIHPRSYPDAYSLAVSFQRSSDKQLVFPAQTAIRLFSMMGRGEAFLSLIVFAVGGCAILTTLLILYWSGAARNRERVLLHVLGVPKSTLIYISWLEGAVTLLIGVFLGELLGRLGATSAFAALGNVTALDSSVSLTLQELAAPLIFLAAGSLGSLFAAWRGRLTV